MIRTLCACLLLLSFASAATALSESRDYAVVLEGKNPQLVARVSAALLKKFDHRLFAQHGKEIVEKTMAAAEPGHFFHVESGRDSERAWRFDIKLTEKNTRPGFRAEVTLRRREGAKWKIHLKRRHYDYPSGGEEKLGELLPRLSFEP